MIRRWSNVLRPTLAVPLLLFAAGGSPDDRSFLGVYVDNAWPLVFDPKGARTGLDPESGKGVREIPRSSVWVDQIDNDVTGEAAKFFTVTVRIERPEAGTYRVVVVGQGRGSLFLDVHAFATDGSAQPSIRVPVSIEKNSRTEFGLHFVKAPGKALRLEKIKSG